MIPADALPKLAKLLRMLGTDSDGECLAACRALGRALQAKGASFHDIADAVEQRHAPCADTEADGCDHTDHGRPATANTWAKLARWLHARADRLTPREVEFTADMARRLGGSSWPTERQAAWLCALEDRLKSQGQRAA